MDRRLTVMGYARGSGRVASNAPSYSGPWYRGPTMGQDALERLSDLNRKLSENSIDPSMFG